MILTWAVPEKYQTRKRGVEDIYTFLKNPLEFLDLSLYLKKVRRKQAFIPRNSAKLCDTTKKFQGQKPGPMEISHDFFLNTPGNSAFFLLMLGISTCLLQCPWKFHVLNTPCFDFFWNNPLSRVC